ncbi:MAG: YncE family protein [Alistipes sp.]|jgi:YVTN family beta-propeller protein|nr:YncE family protein [Alistipes sp.]
MKNILFVRRALRALLPGAVALLAAPMISTSCTEPETGSKSLRGDGSGVFVVNEGTFMSPSASLDWYDPDARKIENDIFSRANDIPLGDTAQSMTVHGGVGYVVVNNSGVIFAVDLKTFEVKGSIEGFTSPRHIHFVSDTKAYVTQMNDPRIAIVDPTSRQITGYIATGGTEMSSVEQMVEWGRFVFANCWSYDNRLLVIDTETDEVTEEIEVGVQPASMALDKNGKIWVVTDGGNDYVAEAIGHEPPALHRVDAATRIVEKSVQLDENGFYFKLDVDGTGGTVYLLNGGVWKFDATAGELPAEPFIEGGAVSFYGMGVDPATGEVYLSDAIDYQQAGVVYRYGAAGALVDEFEVGIAPKAFCFVNE